MVVGRTYSLISSYIQQSSFNYVKSNWKDPSYKKDAKPSEPTLLCVEYTISIWTSNVVNSLSLGWLI